MEQRLKKLLEQAHSAVFFGGAGVSCESGIPDFRSQDGLYHQQWPWPPEEILSHTFFLHHTEEFFRFYREKMLYPNARPNAAHLALARLERQGHVRAVVTQNIDGLHTAAGSRNVLELHGSVHRNRCMECGRQYGLAVVLGTCLLYTSIRLRGTVHITPKKKWYPLATRNMVLKDILEDPEWFEVFYSKYKEIRPYLPFGLAQMDLKENAFAKAMLENMTLHSLASYVGSHLTDDDIDKLIEQLNRSLIQI